MPEKSGIVSCAALSADRLVVVCALAGMVAAKNEKPIEVKAITVVDIIG